VIVYNDFDTSGLWLDTPYSRENYVGELLTDALVKSIEEELGYKLPASYIALMRVQNGGLLAKTEYETDQAYVDVECIYGIDRSKRASLGGILKEREAFTVRNPKTGETTEIAGEIYRTGSRFWIENWGYPKIGVYFAEGPSGGHDMLCLDYTVCGSSGEPQVVHVEQEGDFRISLVAENFEMFVRGLKAASY
jgi:hypothetical protein